MLVIEDNADCATMEALVLATESHDVQIATDGPAALRAVQERQPDVVLLDIGLPGGLDGYEVARRIRAMTLPRRPLLVAVTARGEEEDHRRTTAAGIDMHLVKPVEPEKLCLLMRQFHRVLR